MSNESQTPRDSQQEQQEEANSTSPSITPSASAATLSAEGAISRNSSAVNLGEYAQLPSSASTATMSTQTNGAMSRSTSVTEMGSSTNLVNAAGKSSSQPPSAPSSAQPSPPSSPRKGNNHNKHKDTHESNKDKKKKKKKIRFPKFFRGVKKDLKRRIPYYWSDIKDGIHPTSIASIIFMFFTSIAPALSFGAFLNDKTDGEIGVTEVLLSTTICGILYAIFAGQPLVVVGVTGPVSFFATTIYTLSSSLGLPFLPLFAVCGFWSAIFHVILAITNATTLLKSVTRYTNEIFSILIAAIYIYNSIEELVLFFQNDTIDAALLSLILALGTCAIALVFHVGRKWPFFPRLVASLIADYAVALSILIFTAIAHLPKLNSVKIPFLPVPDNFETTADRSWLVQFQRLPIWGIFFAIIPAAILTTLFFFDHNVSSLLSQRKEFNLKKGTAFHWDFAVIGLNMIPCSILGIPYTNGLIPQAPLHVRSLATIEERKDRHGRPIGGEVFTHVRETRLTALGHAILIGIVAIWGQKILQLIPQGVMTGLFLFMGITSFDGNQFYERVKLFFTNPRFYPNATWQTQVSLKYIFAYTIIQFLCWGVIFGVTLSPASLAFPVFIILLIPLRKFLLPRFFSHKAIHYLDHEDVDAPLLMDDHDDDDENNDNDDDNNNAQEDKTKKTKDADSESIQESKVQRLSVDLNEVEMEESNPEAKSAVDVVVE